MAHYQGEPGFLAWADSVDASVASLPTTYMDLTNAQTAAGNKTFSGSTTFNAAVAVNADTTVTGKVYSTGSSNAGLSFSDASNPASAARFEWYYSAGSARLWSSVSGTDLVTVSTGGNVTAGEGFFGNSQFYGTTNATTFSTQAFIQAQADVVRPLVLRGHSATQSGSLFEIQASSTAVTAFFDGSGLFHQFGAAGASVGTKFVNNSNNADLHFAATSDGVDYVVIGAFNSSFQAVTDTSVPVIVSQHSNTQSASLQRWTNFNTSTILAQITAGGNVQGTGAYTTLSDANAKENVGPLRYDPAQVIRRLKPVHFDYLGGDRDQVGFIAQDVQTVLPPAVVQWDDNGSLGLRSDAVLAYLVAAVQPLIEDYLTRTTGRTVPNVPAA